MLVTCEDLICLVSVELHRRCRVACHVEIMWGSEVLASLAVFLATIWVNDEPFTVLEGCSSSDLSRRLWLHVVEWGLVLTYTRVIGSLSGSACSFNYDFISGGFSKNIYMIVLVLIGNDEVMHILRHGSGVAAAKTRALRPAKHSIRLATSFRFSWAGQHVVPIWRIEVIVIILLRELPVAHLRFCQHSSLFTYASLAIYNREWRLLWNRLFALT